MPKRTHKQFVDSLKDLNPDIDVIGTYTKSSERVFVRCKKCGHEWSPVAAELSRGRGCPRCKGKLRLTTEDFISRMGVVNADIEILGEYVLSNTKIKCRCRICRTEWSAVPSSLLRGHGCPECAKNKQAAKRRKTHERFVAELNIVNANIEVIGKYQSSASPISVRCKVCGHEWAPIASSIVNAGQGCPECSRKNNAIKRTKTTEAFIAEMKAINPNIEIKGDYKTSKSKIQCRCLLCDNTWSAAPGNLLNGYGCPRCARTGTSFIEQFLCVFLETVLVDEEVLSRDKTSIGRELDIVLPSFNLAIEVGSWYWHKNRLRSDREKQALCEKMGIDLITIYDSYPAEEHHNLPMGTITFPYPLDSGSGYEHSKELAFSLAKRLGVDLPSDFDWNEIRDKASRRALPKSSEVFWEEIETINPDIEILGRYAGSHSRIKCKCKICGNEWEPTAHQLLRGQGCPPCGHNKAAKKGATLRRKTAERYAREFQERNPDLVLVGEYVGSLNHIKVRCLKCGHEWSPRAESVIRGNGCPVCADNAKRKTQEEFLEELSSINNRVEIIGSYVKNSTPIKAKCKRCGHIWYPKPVKLLAGRGCPKCAGKMKRPVRCIETGEIFESFSAAAKANNLSSGDTISAVCKGKRTTAGGYTWELVEMA